MYKNQLGSSSNNYILESLDKYITRIVTNHLKVYLSLGIFRVKNYINGDANLNDFQWY